MKAGTLNSRVTIQRFVSEPDPDYGGGSAGDWQDIGTVWADVRFVSGREYTKNGLDSSAAVVSVKVRRNSISAQADNTCRLVFGNRFFNITAVLPDETGKASITFACSAGQNGG